MSKTAEIMKIIISIFIIVVLGVALIIYLAGGKEDDLYSTVHDKKITDDITSVSVKWNSDDVRIMKSDDNTTRIVEKNSNSNKHRLSYEINNGRLSITKKHSMFFMFGFLNGRSNLELYLPEKEYDEIKLDYTSGNYEVLDVKTKSLDIDSSSGRVSLDGVEAKNLGVDITSGSVDFNGSAENVNVDITSGKAKIKTNTMLERLDVKVTSGSTEVSIPENDGFITKVKRTSGKFSSDFEYKSDGDRNYYKEGGPEFNVSLTSGKVHLKRN